MCMCAYVYVRINAVPAETKRGLWIPWSWSYKRLWAAEHGCWEPNSGALWEQFTISATKPSLHSGYSSAIQKNKVVPIERKWTQSYKMN